MDTDVLIQESDEEVELFVTKSNVPINLAEYELLNLKNQPAYLEAKTIYILMPKDVPISRTARFQWFLDHLNTIISVPILSKPDCSSTELEIISIIPKVVHTDAINKYLITNNTTVTFLAHSYCFVYCVDMGPSQSAVDIEKGEILFDEIIHCFKVSLEELCRQFTIPGTSVNFQPILYLTVIVNTPFFMTPAQQVLVKGVKVSSHNIQEIICLIEKQFQFIEEKIAQVSVMAHDEIEQQRVENEGIIGSLFHLKEGEQCTSHIPMVSPDTNFVNMLRYSILAISLLPENSLNHILVITDGVVAMPDSNIMESLLVKLHYDSIQVSFLKVGPKFHPHSSAGYIPYLDLLRFISHCTLGTCLEEFPKTKLEPSSCMNIYQTSYLLWTFHGNQKYNHFPLFSQNKRIILNHSFNLKEPILLSKMQTEENINASVFLLFARRMREGYVVDRVKCENGVLQVHLSLEWKPFTYIQYHIHCQWPIVKHMAHVEVHILAPYEFLHDFDITCLIKKEPKSSYRQAIIEKFWLRLSQLSSGDMLLAKQLSSIQSSPVWCTLPESVKSGIPVFILNGSDSTKLVLSPRDISCPKFMSVWQPICQIENVNWKRWFHAHKLTVALKYDHPLPPHLHLANSSGRFQVIQCRQAASALYSMLSEWSSFILIDNHTYLKFLYEEQERFPTWFCLVRVMPKFPCAIINIGFITGTPGRVRHKICEELKLELSSLSYLLSPIKSKDNMCCKLLQKPLERILIRYERMPTDFSTVIFPDGTRPLHSLHTILQSPLVGTLFTTLSRYLFHKRWIWNTSHTNNHKLEMTTLSRILSTLTRMRIKEGFNFAHSSSGIITMVLELHMDSSSSCLLQYVLFPPHRAWREGDLTSGSEEDIEPESELDSELQMVTEVWVEPQFGTVKHTKSNNLYLDDKQYYEIADVIRQMDMQCIHALLTLGHLNLICQNKSHMSLCDPITQYYNESCKQKQNSNQRNNKNGLISYAYDIDERIQQIPFIFDPISILPLCQQTELLFSMFIEGKNKISSINDCENEISNKLLLDNIYDHLQCLHDHELDTATKEFERLTKLIISRHRNKPPNLCPISLNSIKENIISTASMDLETPQWKCFIKGVSVTHIILTFIPGTLQSLKKLISTNSNSDSSESIERTSSRESNLSNVPINSTNFITLPIYVFDCPLALLVESYVKSLNNNDVTNNDLYEDHRFKFGSIVTEDFIRLKAENKLNDSPEPKSDESESNDNKSNIRQHCKALVLTHSKCFVMSLFSALQQGAFVHNYDVQSAMDQCEETLFDIDISYYMQTICGHLKHQTENINLDMLLQPQPCTELKPLHRLIKEKFMDIMNVAFHPIPTNREFYYYRNIIIDKLHLQKADSDDEISIPPSDGVEFKSDKEISFTELSPGFIRPDTINSIYLNTCMTPLFIHLICTVHYNNNVVNTSVKVLPTCLGELTQSIQDDVKYFEKSKIRITLDILCLTLPTDVQNVINDYSTKEMRTTSFCSDGFQPSINSATSDNSFVPEFSDPLAHLPQIQKKAIDELKYKITWLLKDEIATALLDTEPVTFETLNFVINHVNENAGSTSCLLDIIDLNFVYGSNHSYEKFIKEFAKIDIPFYKLCKEENYYYITKSFAYNNLEYGNSNFLTTDFDDQCLLGDSVSLKSSDKSETIEITNEDVFIKTECASHQSETSSINESYLSSDDGGYDEDVSEDDDDFNWLIQLDRKREHLPNFWLIMCINHNSVTIYFHCRFLELPTTHVGTYLQVQRAVRDAIRDLCKQVNQSLLLQSLHDTRICDILLEQDDNFIEWHSDASTPTITRNTSFSRLKSMDEACDESELYPFALSDTSLKFKSGYFSCPVVWQTQFILHPRLKTGPGKPGFSRGVAALKTVLDKFSVSNRNNMFVYQDVQSNVFYLRLHENIQSFSNKGSLAQSSEYENTIVSRSPSIASLPLGPQKSSLTQSQQSIALSIGKDSDIRPRVRSFGERDSLYEDTLILKVHGITEAGEDVRSELVQVLQNRLDDAILECLSIMLSRNVMCPLTPEDVHFLQKPFRLPETVVRLSIQEYAIKYLNSFLHYLRQNLLQFLNIPKYTDSRSHYHFKDYTDNEQSSNSSENIFIYNQSQNPSSGNRGIACIALAVVTQSETNANYTESFLEIFKRYSFQEIISTKKLEDNEKPSTYIEFRLWKQGRINMENLYQKLSDSTSQALWDIIIEYYLLQSPLCEKNLEEQCKIIMNTNRLLDDNMKPIAIFSKNEIEYNITLKITTPENVNQVVKENQDKSKKIPKILVSKKQNKYIPLNSTIRRSLLFDNYVDLVNVNKHSIKLDPYEMGESGIMSETCSTTLCKWLDFGVEFSVPAVRKNVITLTNRHFIHTVIKELQNIVKQLSQDSTKVFMPLPIQNNDDNFEEVYVPYNSSYSSTKAILISRNFEQWKAYTLANNLQDYPDLFNPQLLKHTQKFTPTITIENKLIPRQKLFWAFIETNKILLYTYNWSKDITDKLIEYGSNLGLWLSVRGGILNSVTTQKLGIFYNQTLTRNNLLSSNNPFLNFIDDVELMMNFSKDRTRRSNVDLPNQPISMLEAFRDIHPTTTPSHYDPVVVFCVEIQQLKCTDRKHKDELKKLHSMWQSRTSTCTSVQIQILKQHSRITHFCHTPLLFLSRWRFQSASTRDHSFSHSVSDNLDVLIQKNNIQNNKNDSWHSNLCHVFISEYKCYLQTLGFIPLQIESAPKKHSVPRRDHSSCNSVFYVQKATLGGILIFSIHLNEPFLITKLYTIECKRLQSTNSRTSINQFTLSFLDESDRVKIAMHLHSFTYDFHLRCIHNYVSNSSNGGRVCEGYHLTHFLDDFMKYYNKAPNFARNLVHQETITIKELITEGRQLYDYLLSNGKQYNMEVFSMYEEDNESTEYVLVQLGSTPQMYYNDSQDCQHTDDFNITLVISRLNSPYEPVTTLHLKYYLILTCHREIYPKMEIDRKLGKFRTVSSMFRSNSTYEKEINVEETINSSISSAKCITSDDIEFEKSLEKTASFDFKSETTSQKSKLTVSSQEENSQKLGEHGTTQSHVEIKQELVNYLGYYSSHEQLMQQLMLEHALATDKKIKDMVSRGMVDCRTHLLWNKLISPQELNCLTYNEFIELKSLARVENLSDLHPNLSSLLNQRLSWYQGLSKLFLIKYYDQHRVFISPDENIQHFVILHSRYHGAFMLLSMDLHTSRGNLYAVYRTSNKCKESNVCSIDRKALLSDFINCICFHIWTGLL